MSEKLNTT